MNNEATEKNYIADATYSPEDNKIRLYLHSRVDSEQWQEIKEAGFNWAPKQELVYAAWTPSREDYAIELAGNITAEQMSLVERAEAKAQRLDTLAEKREEQASGFHTAANSIAARFDYGQPILIGHHSERRARKDKERMNSAMRKAIKASEAVSYWNYRANGVERHANRNSNPAVRARRIKKLLAEMRDSHRDINHAKLCVKLWIKILEVEDLEIFKKTVLHYARIRIQTGSTTPYLRDGSYYSKLCNEELTHKEVAESSLSFWSFQAESPNTLRWISHYLNRLAYENSEQGETIKHSETITAAILQTFTRTHGADMPKAKKSEKGFILTSEVDLPYHLTNGEPTTSLDLTSGEWIELMQAVGYEVPAAKPKAPPILNFKADTIRCSVWGKINDMPQQEMTKAEYGAIYTDSKACKLSECGTFKVRVCINPNERHLGYQASWVTAFLTDSKEHEAPKSSAINHNAVNA